ncbi:MAG: cytochrome c-type biogenesis protein CcmH [Myxococcota bacterium]|nr:cytochrome c-type biogenesis protein CcmH [Myxococcota bacterium]
MFLGLACVFVLLSGSGPAHSQPELQSEAPSWGYGLSHELMSPFCPGRTLAACTSPQAAELRQWILLQEAAGTSREEVIVILEERFGDAIRSTPEVEGWGLAAWLLPVSALAIGAVLVFLVLRRLVGPPSGTRPDSATQADREPPAAGSADDQDLARRVDQELAARNR